MKNRKRMMMAAAAAAAAGVCLAAGAETPKVTSSNIVGYQKMSLTAEALTPAVSTFIPVGSSGAAATLGDTIAANDAWDPTGDTIQILKPNGATDKTYTYLNAANAGMIGCEVGWYDVDAMNQGRIEPVSSTPLPAGAGILAKANAPGVQLIFKGEVSRETVTLPLTAEALTPTGNTAPADLTLADITANDAWDPTGDTIQILKPNGATDKTYTYLNAANAGMIGCEVGWYDVDAMNQGRIENVSTTPLPAGAGILAKANAPGVELILPKAAVAD